MTQNLQQNKKFVEKVFNTVYSKYDLMNDFMSLGIHRHWKKNLITMMNPSNNQSLIDVGSGTGDIAKLYSNATKNNAKILCVEPNELMINEGKKRLEFYNNIKWKKCSAEKLLVNEDSFDFYTISFGLRNTSNLDKSIREAYRVLKKGGRYLCLEFSKIENENLEFLYKQYSKFLPKIGSYIVGDSKPYEYLTKSIENFVNQEELLELIKAAKFENAGYVNLSGGIVSIHYGWKI